MDSEQAKLEYKKILSSGRFFGFPKKEPESSTKGKEDFTGHINGRGYKGSMDDPHKPPLSLVPPTAKLWMGQVLGHGATKYARGQWMQGMSYSEIADAVQRHLDKWQQGEDLDTDSGLNHLAHAMAGLAFLSWFIAGPDAEGYSQFDDRLFIGSSRFRERLTPTRNK